jgi:hypothetical protein
MDSGVEASPEPELTRHFVDRGSCGNDLKPNTYQRTKTSSTLVRAIAA